MNPVALDFEKIHADFRPKIQRYLTRLVGAPDAEDLTQEVMLKINRALNTFRGEAKLSTWIYRIATNTALDRLRNSSTRPIVENAVSDDMLDADTLSLDEQICHKERYECYRDFVQDLPPNYRTVVALSELEELAVAEIADILGLSVDVVKIRLHRGRTKLIDALKNHCKPEDWL